MNIKVLLSVVVLATITSCGKDKYTSKPQLTFKSVNSTEISRNGRLEFLMEVTDAEGDIQDTMWVQRSVARCPGSDFELAYVFPEFTGTKNLKGEVKVCYDYSTNSGCPNIGEPKCRMNDTAIYRFWIQDKEKNISDTIVSPPVVIVQ